MIVKELINILNEYELHEEVAVKVNSTVYSNFKIDEGIYFGSAGQTEDSMILSSNKAVFICLDTLRKKKGGEE